MDKTIEQVWGQQRLARFGLDRAAHGVHPRRTGPLVELGEMEDDAATEKEGVDAMKALLRQARQHQIEALFSGEADGNDTYIEVHSGAGGTESQDWTRMLFRMYARWAERKKFKVDVIEETPGEEAGLKSGTLLIKGHNAHGWAKTESGVHRLVRISPFDSNARRHTSFASVFVYPVVDDEITIELRDEDIKMDVFRASGAGGQHVNKTSSAVRLTHIPTGIVVSCQQERSQFKNKATAMKMLKNALYQREVEERERKKAAMDAAKTDVSFGNQIRSYVFQPYTMVNDHRTELKVTDVQKVMDGAIDPFIEAYLRKFGASEAVA